jgi:NAD kinase
MVDMTFRGLPNVQVELFDLEASTFTRSHELERRFASLGEIWHVVDAELVRGAASGRSAIQTTWQRGAELWRQSRFIVIKPPGPAIEPADLPPTHQVIELDVPVPRDPIRDKVFRHQSVAGLVVPQVADYIARHQLYRGGRATRSCRLRLEEVRPALFVDEHNPRARQLADPLASVDPVHANVIVVIGGDGTMLRAIRQHWRQRLPFFGINAGHAGFLLNESPSLALADENLVVHQMPLLWVESEGPDGVQSALAFNDAWVERTSGQTAWIEVKIDGRVRIERLVGDGALVATPAGSTSYARAMGAPPLPLPTPAIILAGSNVLRPEFFKPVVLPIDAYVELTTLDPLKRPMRAFLDGLPLGGVHSLRARLSRCAAAELAFHKEHDPAEKLARIQFPPPKS